jgi:hypothetical protein
MKTLRTLASLAATLLVPALSQPARAQQATLRTELDRTELAIQYKALHTNASVGDCGCFWAQGGSASIAVPVWRDLAAVAEIDGEHANSIPNLNVGISLLSGMAGPKYSHTLHTRYKPFAQTLFGGAHAFNSYFPVTAADNTHATSFAMALGAGLDIHLTPHISIRAVQADYQYMQLPNNNSNQQHDLTLSSGIVIRIGKSK